MVLVLSFVRIMEVLMGVLVEKIIYFSLMLICAGLLFIVPITMSISIIICFKPIQKLVTAAALADKVAPVLI